MSNKNKFCHRKNFFAAAIAAITVMSMTMTASAESIETATNNSAQTSISEVKDTVWVGGYECWVEDGHYITRDSDGELSEVIDLSEIEWTPVNNISNTTAQLSLQSSNEVDVSGSNTYSGKIDATVNDYESPVFVGWTRPDPFSDLHPNARLNYTIRCDDVVFSRQHMTEIYVYSDILGWGLGNTRNIVFSLVIKKVHLVNGGWNEAPTKVQIICRNGDGNKKATNYSVYTEIIKYEES